MAYLEWLSDARKALVLGTDNFIARDFRSPAEFLDPSRLLPLLGQLDVRELLGQHWSRLARRFKSPRIAAMLSFQDLYVGLSPYSASGQLKFQAVGQQSDDAAGLLMMCVIAGSSCVTRAVAVHSLLQPYCAAGAQQQP